MRVVWFTATTLLILCCAPVSQRPAIAGGPTPAKKPRVVATTDGETDDRCSMVRFLMYADQWDIKGLVYSSSKHHWKGDGDDPGRTWSGETWIQEQIDQYARVYARLQENESGYPSPDYLKSRVFVGNIALEGDMRKATPGSDRIVEVLLDPDPSPVWLQAWGGPNTIARALKTIEQQHPDRRSDVVRKARIYLIAEQDRTYRDYIRKKWPKVQVFLSSEYGAIAYRWRDIMTPSLQKYFDGDWMKRNILKGHGPLCALYEAKGDGQFRSEGDSPAFMHLIDVGLGGSEDPTYGGWGGRFERREGLWKSALDDGRRYESILRWAVAFQNDWAARADWCVKPFNQCNHPPLAVCQGDRTRKILRISADPGDRVALRASGSSDPDGDRLSYAWWVYTDAGTYRGDASIRSADAVESATTVPSDAAGGTIHVILKVVDDGTPPLAAYRRIILQVRGDARPASDRAQPKGLSQGRGDERK